MIGVAVAAVYLAVLAFLSETSHPGTTGKERSQTPHPKYRPVILNFFSALLVLRNPALLFIVRSIALVCVGVWLELTNRECRP
jgi:hypothetical protein